MNTNRTIHFVVGLAVVFLALYSTLPGKLQAYGDTTAARNVSWDFVAVDSKGTVMGPVAAVEDFGESTVLVIYHGTAFPVGVSRNSFVQRGLFFGSSDCTGQAYAQSDGIFSATAVSGNDNTLYVESGTTITLDSSSQLVTSGGVTNCVQYSYSFPGATPVVPLFNLNDRFTPPFKAIHRPLN